MNQKEKRKIALEAARSQFRRIGIQPKIQTASQALALLDDLLRSEPDLIASRWYDTASDHQKELFEREWQKWQATSYQIKKLRITDGDDRVLRE